MPRRGFLGARETGMRRQNSDDVSVALSASVPRTGLSRLSRFHGTKGQKKKKKKHLLQSIFTAVHRESGNEANLDRTVIKVASSLKSDIDFELAEHICVSKSQMTSVDILR